jgi:hypothetical protein
MKTQQHRVFPAGRPDASIGYAGIAGRRVSHTSGAALQ